MTTKNELDRGTCQVCGRQQSIGTDGLMVLHGYTRPGDGYTVGRCYDVGTKPFELDRDVLGGYIKMIEREIKETQKTAKQWRDGTLDGAIFSYSQYDRATYKSVRKTVEVMKADFEKGGKVATEKLETANITFRKPGTYISQKATWELVAERKATDCDSHVTFLKGHLADQQKRYDGWTLAPEKIIKGGSVEKLPVTKTQLKLLARFAKAKAEGAATFALQAFLSGWGSQNTNRLTERQLFRAMMPRYVTRDETQAEHANARGHFINTNAYDLTKEGEALLAKWGAK
jgi:hypothetical protein